jgi:hypothetical protein
LVVVVYPSSPLAIGMSVNQRHAVGLLPARPMNTSQDAPSQSPPPKKRKAPRNYLVLALIILILPVWLPLVLFLFVLRFVLVYLLVWLVWLPRGKNVLFVYSESPIWKEYMIDEILPLVRERAVILNWSERARWKRFSLALQIFEALGGDREFNPLVVVFRPLQNARKFRFWSAFKAWKHGDKEPVERLRQELLNELSSHEL